MILHSIPADLAILILIARKRVISVENFNNHPSEQLLLSRITRG